MSSNNNPCTPEKSWWEKQKEEFSKTINWENFKKVTDAVEYAADEANKAAHQVFNQLPEPVKKEVRRVKKVAEEDVQYVKKYIEESPKRTKENREYIKKKLGISEVMDIPEMPDEFEKPKVPNHKQESNSKSV